MTDGESPQRRFIPACAGNTVMKLPSGSVTSGSSPHARGTPVSETHARLWRRFIPACAGNTPCQAYSFVHRSVHPRMRGEHNRGGGTVLIRGGSSPHARGTLLRAVHRSLNPRFIPACAGNTIRQRREFSSRTVHPRMRGEHCVQPTTDMAKRGSSPHARGTRRVVSSLMI